MYRDDVCAVCGESLPPDHLYCREHAATVDARLHELGALLPSLAADLRRAADLVAGIHDETWDYLAEVWGAEQEAGDPEWPPRPSLVVATDGEDVDVDVDSEPGRVTVTVALDLDVALTGLAGALEAAGLDDLAAAARDARGAGATH